MQRTPLFLDHDGGVDDILSLLLILTMEEVDLLGVAVTPADCYPGYAIETSRKLLDLMGQSHVAVAESDVRGINPFPSVWRAQPHVINAFPPLLNVEKIKSPLSPHKAVYFIKEILQAADEPITYLMTGPCTTLVTVLQQEPWLREKIGQIVWMAGAVDVPGNVAMYTHDNTAEWNVYWDAPSAQWLFEQNLPLIIFPLDATNHVPVSMDFLKQLARQSEYEVSNLASVCWATTINTVPSYEYLYHMWDVLATSYVARPDLFTTEKLELTVAVKPPNEGQTLRDPGNGQWVTMAKSADVEGFYGYLLEQSRRDFVY